MGFRAKSAQEVYRYALRLDEPHRSLTDRFGFSLVFVNDGSPVCIEFLQRYFVDLCHRTADRIRFIFFSNLDERKLERTVMRRRESRLQIILRRMLTSVRRRYPYWQDEYLDMEPWDELRPRGFDPVHSPERTLRNLNWRIQKLSTVPGVKEAFRFAQQLGIGRHVPCIVAFNDIGSLSVDVMPIRGMTPREIYDHVREWVDSFYEKNQVIFDYWSEVEREINRLHKKSQIPLHKINEWEYHCRKLWNELRIIANVISEISLLNYNDRVEFFQIINKYIRINEYIRILPNKIIKYVKNFQQNNYNYNPCSNQVIINNLLDLENKLVNNLDFEQLYNQLKIIREQPTFYRKYCQELIKYQTIIHERYILTKEVKWPVYEYLDWWKKAANIGLSWKKFKDTRNAWIHILDPSYHNVRIRDEFKYIFQFIRQFPLSINPNEGAEAAILELAKYYTVDPENQQWLIATEEFRDRIINYINIIQKTCPRWLIENNPNLTIRDAIPLGNEPGSYGKIDSLPKDHPLLTTITAISENHESRDQQNKLIADECRSQCLQAIRKYIEKYTLGDDEFNQMRSNFINLLREHRNQLEAKVNKSKESILSVGLFQKQITPEEIQKLKNELDNYQAIVRTIVYPHKADPKIINLSVSQKKLVEAFGLNYTDRDLSNNNINQNYINNLKQKIDVIPKKEQKNLERYNQVTEIAKLASPQDALSYALKETIPPSIIEKAFTNPENINFNENIGTLVKSGNIVIPLLKLTENDLTKVIKVLSKYTDHLFIKFNDKTHPVEQIMILIGADVIPALNHIQNINININQIKDSTMINSQTKIFSELEQDDIVKLELYLYKIFTNIDSIQGRKGLLSNGGVNQYFIGNLDFNINISEFITILVAKFKQYRVSSRKPDYHPLISFLEYLIEQGERYNLDDQDIDILCKILAFGKQKLQLFTTENTQIKPNLVISKIGNSEPVIGIITALPKEYVAVQAVFDQGQEEKKPGKGAGRRYWLTDVADSNGTPQIVAVTLADMGNNAAAMGATTMLSHYPMVQSIIMCGIAGGVPHPTKVEDHVRLGDIIVSNKKGIVQYDFDKESQQFTEIRAMPVPASAELVEAAKYLRVNEMLGQRPWEDVILKALQKLNWQRPPQETDLLHSSEQPDQVIPHPQDSKRLQDQPKIFLGAIGSANKLLKNPQKRDMLRKQFGVKAIEMEGSGVADATWNHGIGYIVVRGICDYCDSHKSDTWQQYAAVTAAAYVRTLLSSM
ncbi:MULTISPECIES: hypothetical protein [unclassified Moorena]|uniref:phosphorylase family protein n=1 Tax=unclassified Moorena TaxID=2683338 RepID=UPI0013C721B7|nr:MULTISPECIES: hypothetical protein [unclassified Moorena]NEO18363.1 5'-methylthioadenosine/S-adenosylhomocysteine nucleosidase [Moorena sp. SIO4A5]NEP24796.1 5'-methylthioadenosine/S-adenosylhomocysteine nucleosidase [Moorena sp. SIO3I6]NEQ60613.1 5'-methylthioadenosine/S-adenosylhomocysteine nucleosidase [Moorena sp. SIO4A1]